MTPESKDPVRAAETVLLKAEAAALLAERRRYEFLRDGRVIHTIEGPIYEVLEAAMHYHREFVVGWKAEIRYTEL